MDRYKTTFIYNWFWLSLSFFWFLGLKTYIVFAISLHVLGHSSEQAEKDDGVQSLMDWKAPVRDVAKFWTCNQHVLEEVTMVLTAEVFVILTPRCKRRSKNLDMV